LAAGMENTLVMQDLPGSFANLQLMVPLRDHPQVAL